MPSEIGKAPTQLSVSNLPQTSSIETRHPTIAGVASKRRLRFDRSGEPRCQRAQQDDRPDNKSGNESGHPAEVVGQRTASAGEKDPIAHNMQMKERRNGREYADGQRSSARNARAGDAMGGPVQCLRQARNTENHNQISQPPPANPQRFLLHPGVNPRGERDISNFNPNHGQAAAKTGAAHGCQVHRRAGARTEKSTLPVPAGKGLPEQGADLWEHSSIVPVRQKTEHQGKVTVRLRLIPDRNQADSARSISFPRPVNQRRPNPTPCERPHPIQPNRNPPSHLRRGASPYRPGRCRYRAKEYSLN